MVRFCNGAPDFRSHQAFYGFFYGSCFFNSEEHVWLYENLEHQFFYSLEGTNFNLIALIGSFLLTLNPQLQLYSRAILIGPS